MTIRVVGVAGLLSYLVNHHQCWIPFNVSNKPLSCFSWPLFRVMSCEGHLFFFYYFFFNSVFVRLYTGTICRQPIRVIISLYVQPTHFMYSIFSTVYSVVYMENYNFYVDLCMSIGNIGKLSHEGIHLLTFIINIHIYLLR